MVKCWIWNEFESSAATMSIAPNVSCCRCPHDGAQMDADMLWECWATLYEIEEIQIAESWHQRSNFIYESQVSRL